jgi:hypothetical protein
MLGELRSTHHVGQHGDPSTGARSDLHGPPIFRPIDAAMGFSTNIDLAAVLDKVAAALLSGANRQFAVTHDFEPQRRCHTATRRVDGHGAQGIATRRELRQTRDVAPE